MKNIYIILVIYLLSSAATAQITLTKPTSVPQVGDTFKYVKISSPSSASVVKASGVNHTWDFSSYTGTSGSIFYVNLANSQLPSRFAAANLVETDTTGIENYYEVTSNGVNLVGQNTGSVIIDNNSNVREQLKFPITYNDVFTETFSGVVEVGASQTLNRSGNINIKADGYGTLILPDTTFNDVLRVRAAFDYSDAGLPSTYKDTIYTWYTSSIRTFVASATVSYADGLQTLAQVTYMEDFSQNDSSSNTPPTSIEHLSIETTTFYPNPADDYIRISTAEGKVSVSISDLGGKVIKKEEILNPANQEIDISDLTPGVYLLTYSSNAIRKTEKLMVR